MASQVISELFTNTKENIPFKISEDCLYLNIYTPADLTKKSRLPVSGEFRHCGIFWWRPEEEEGSWGCG